METENANSRGLIVVSSLTGSDRTRVLAQTENLPSKAPASGDSGYAAFMQELKQSPVNVVSTIIAGLQARANWEITSDHNYQVYLNQFNGAPFLLGTAGGHTDPTNVEYNSPEDAIAGILSAAGVPDRKADDLSSDMDLEDFLSGDFEDDPKTLSFITQNIDQTDGNIAVTFTSFECTVTYTPGEKKAFRDKRKPPVYTVKGKAISSTLQMQNKAYFAENGAQFLGFGFTKVTDWIKNASTAPIKKNTIFSGENN